MIEIFLIIFLTFWTFMNLLGLACLAFMLVRYYLTNWKEDKKEIKEIDV